jgi:hypothetical protein
MATAYSGEAPKHLWAVGILSLLWNAFGGYDYVMTETGNLAYFEMMGMGQAELGFFASLPPGGWRCGRWACGARSPARSCC